MNRTGYISMMGTLLGVAMLVQGCIMLRSGEMPSIQPWPLASTGEKRSISVVVAGRAVINEVPHDVPGKMLDNWRTQVVRAYVDSTLFSRVAVGLEDTDIRAEVNIVDYGVGSEALAFLSGLTMTLIPAKGTDELILETVIKDRSGNTVGTFKKSEKVTLWIQFFTIFAMPFNWPDTVATEALYDVNRATISEAHAKGAI